MDEEARLARNRYANDWYHAHRDQVRAEQKKYRDRNKDELNCKRAAWRETHREELREAERVRRIANRDAINNTERAKGIRQRRWFYANLRILKAAQGCGDCGTHDGRLDHHHTNPGSKTFSVSKMSKSTTERFVDEIGKCVVLCPSCHTKRHWNDRWSM